MTKSNLSQKRNVEDIRRKNLEDNQLFLEKLLMKNIRNDFLHSARSILRRKENIKSPIKRKKIEYSTRYSVKVKSGEIPPHVPEWQQDIQRKLLEKEQMKLENERKKQEILARKEQKKLENEKKIEEILARKEQMKLENEKKIEEILFEKELKRIESIIMFEEKVKIRIANRRLREPSKWDSFYKNSVNGNPYGRVLRPQHTTVGKRNEQISE